jgi:hypothetical protein
MTDEATTSARCRSCSSVSVTPLLDAGWQPVAHCYLRSSEDCEERFPLLLAQCQQCGLIQLSQPVRVQALVPRFDWITYNEPEGHLDAAIRLIRTLPGLSSSSVAAGITYKDDSTLARLRTAGIQTGWRLDPVADLDADRNAGLETIQDRLTPSRARELAAHRLPVDVLLVRHILEHVVNPAAFADALRAFVHSDGYLMFEAPECTQVLDNLDYTTIWEEHVAYYTPATFRGSLERLGFDIIAEESYPYPYENSLVTIARPRGGTAAKPTDLPAELARGTRFGAGFENRKAAFQGFLRNRCVEGHRTALFGAGHLSCMFINLMDVAAEIAFVVDDHPGKCGLLMPGSHLPIRGSDALVTEGIDLCLSTLSPESEDKVAARQTAFVERGGRFASVFPTSRRALVLSAEGESAC